MKRIDKNGKKRKLNIKYIYCNEGKGLETIMKEGYLCSIRSFKKT